MRIKLYSITTLALVFCLLAILATCSVLQDSHEPKKSHQRENSHQPEESFETADEFGFEGGFQEDNFQENNFQENNFHKNKNSNAPFKQISLAPLDDWQTRRFKGKTLYSLEEGATVIRAESDGSASMLIKQQVINLDKTPWVNWEWKLEQPLANKNEKEKKGDDYAARIYIAIAPKSGSLYPRALNYVWASQQPVNSHWPNPYTDNVIMVSVAQGAPEDGAAKEGIQKQGAWRSQKRNLKQDLKDFFGEDFDQIQGIAIMTDTDDTGQKATAWYRGIYFSEN